MAVAPSNGAGGLPAGSVYLTRDCIHFRTAKSPVANLASAFFGLLSGGSESPASVSARRCFAHAVLDHPLPSPANANYTAEMDAQIRSHFTATGGPTLVLIQGPYRVDFILEDPPTPGTPKSVGTINTMSSTMTAANGGPANLMDAIFVGYTLHNELLRCSREDKEQFARLALFLLITLAHETSHWLYSRVHGYRRDDQRHSATGGTLSSGASIKSSGASSSVNFGLGGAAGNVNISQAGQKSEDPLVSFGQKREDCGARTTDMLLGGTAMMVSWADGDTEIVRRKVQPAISTDPPALSAASIESLIGAKLPKITDITGQPPILIGGAPPKWSEHDAYLVTSQTVVNSFCPHGVCRIGDLF